MLAAGTEPRSAVGRAFVYRLSPGSIAHSEARGWPTYLPGYDRRSLAATVERLKARTDAETAKVLDIIATAPTPWVGAFAGLVAENKRRCPECTQAQLQARTDRDLSRVMMLATLDPDPAYLADTLLRIGQYLLPFHVDHSKTRVAREFAANPWFSYADIVAGFPVGWEAIEQAIGPLLVALRSWAFPLCVLIVAWARLRRREPAMAALALGCLATAVVYAALMSVVTVYIRRYGLFVDQLALAAAMIAGLGEPPRTALRGELAADPGSKDSRGAPEA